MHRLRVPRACFSLLLPLSLATRLMWLGGCALLLFVTQASAGQVSLAWDAMSAPTLAGYRLYYGQTSRSYSANINIGLQTTATVTSLTAGQTYYFAVTAYDSTGMGSPFSNEVNTTIPTTAPPVATFSATPTTGPAPLPVQFTDTSTGSLSTWAWSFGDGTSSTAQNPQHTYSTAGSYTVSLTVTGSGGSATKAASISVTVPPPVANFSATPTTGPAPLPVQFTDTSTGSLSTWAWSFGDGTSSTAQNPQHTYGTAGSYTVSLKVTGSGGSATKAASISVTVAPPVATFSATPTTGPAPLLVQFTDASTGSMNTWAWSFGDGTSSTTRSPQHTYSTTGTYTVSLTVSGPGGSNTATKANSITVKTNATGLVAAYSFDEGSGTTVTDVSGYGNKGTITGATWTTAGKFGGALAFNGTSNWITVNDAPALDFTTGMTLEAWVYPTKPTTWSTAIMKEQPGDFVYVLYASASNKRPGLFINVSTSSSGEHGIVVPPSSALPTNTWSHLAGTYDGTTLRLYVNGALVTSQTFAGLIAPSTGALRIGGNNVWGQYFQGRIDEVRIYNRALSASEIQADMSTPINVLNSVSLLP